MKYVEVTETIVLILKKMSTMRSIFHPTGPLIQTFLLLCTKKMLMSSQRIYPIKFSSLNIGSSTMEILIKSEPKLLKMLFSPKIWISKPTKGIPKGFKHLKII